MMHIIWMGRSQNPISYTLSLTLIHRNFTIFWICVMFDGGIWICVAFCDESRRLVLLTTHFGTYQCLLIDRLLYNELCVIFWPLLSTIPTWYRWMFLFFGWAFFSVGPAGLLLLLSLIRYQSDPLGLVPISTYEWPKQIMSYALLDNGWHHFLCARSEQYASTKRPFTADGMACALFELIRTCYISKQSQTLHLRSMIIGLTPWTASEEHRFDELSKSLWPLVFGL